MTIEELFGSTAPKILSSAHHLLDFSLHTHLLPASPIKYGTYIFEYPTPIPPKTRGLRNNCPAVRARQHERKNTTLFGTFLWLVGKP